MKSWVLRTLVVAGMLFATSSAHALQLRSPQVPFNFGPLQAYLNVVDSGINVGASQLNAEVWSVSITGNTDFTLMLKTPVAQGNTVGIYDGPAAIPALFQVFPPGSVPGWYATLHFGGGNVIVSTFNQFSAFQGSVGYGPINQNSFGFYTAGPCGTWFSQDSRNPNPQVLSYASNDLPGDYWVCFEECQYDTASTFDGVVINIQSVRPTDATNSTWGKVKGLYR